MKKILYFLIGLSFALFIGTYNVAYALDITVEMQNPVVDFSTASNYSTHVMGFYKTTAEAQSAYDSFASSHTTYAPSSGWSSSYESHFVSYTGEASIIDAPVRRANYVTYFPGAIFSTPKYYLIWFAYDAPDVVFLQPDADGDGINDDYDLYPNDTEPYKFSILACVENSTTGEKVQCLVKTDRGDIFAFGTRPEDMTGYIDTINANPLMIDGSDAEALFATQTATNTTTVDNSALYDTVTDSLNSPADAGTDTGSGFSPGESVTGSESDSELLEKIAKNTTTQNTNTTRLGDYLKDINSTLKNIDLKQTLTGSGAITLATNGTTTGTSTSTTATDVQTGVEDALTPGVDDVSNATTAGGNTDSAFAEAQGAITGTASLDDDAPDDFKEKTDVGSYIDDMLENSPFMNLITGTGVSTSGSNPTLTYMYKGHPIALTVAGFETELNAFGAILIAITTLAGMLMIFRG